METLHKKLIMKKPMHSTKTQDPPKPVRGTTLVGKKQDLLSDSPVNLSRERLIDGTLATTEVLNEILKNQKPSEAMRHWGINE
jgi:hypothetical protein